MREQPPTATFEMAAETVVDAECNTVFDYVSDLVRAGEWSPECTGGRWIEGPPAQVDSVFEGRNVRAEEVVAWAPVVRGEWYTLSKVIVSDRPTEFRWAMCDSAGQPQESIWGFEMDSQGQQTALRHSFYMGRRTEGLGEILSSLSDEDEQRFLDEWAQKLHREMSQVVQEIKARLETS